MKAKYEELTRLEEERLANKDDPKWQREEPDRELDRYANIHPWAGNRIKLVVPEGYNDYINASPVTLTSTAEKQSAIKKGLQDKYICMQGPKAQTVDHTWHMMWHSITVPDNAAPGVIIMLSALTGPNPANPSEIMEKCYKYYPMSEDDPPLHVNESMQLGENFKATVRFVSRENNVDGTGIEVRKLAMSVEGEEDEKTIWHFFYPLWPDAGSLNRQNVNSVLTLMDLTRAKNVDEENPRVVHCSAGVGRTGTFVALEFLMGELQGGAWEGWDESEEKGTDAIFETVNQLRMQRKTMVQALEQYVFLYEVCRKVWEEKYMLPCIGGEHTHDNPPEEGKNVHPLKAIPEA
ncbi:tyrosine phosphatase protein [Rutstroemia sp. NJR-2017a BVV2]|nr:tyrosine phosphatase protein [Rutstroemia sp. NJR-2017a BVV2]